MESENRLGLLDSTSREFMALSEVEKKERIAFAIRKTIEFREIRVSRLAKLIGRSPNTIHRWSNGETLPNAIDIGILSAALMVDPVLFIYPPPPPRNPIDDYLIENRD